MIKKQALISVCLIWFLLLNGVRVGAVVISPAAQEVTFSYKAQFVTQTNDETSDEDISYYHATHLFGVFHSAGFGKKFNLKYHKVEGIGAIRSNLKIKILQSRSDAFGNRVITYSANGKMLLQNVVLKTIRDQKKMLVPMPYQLDHIYDQNCTDEYYDSLADYWYFFNPFKKGCEFLLDLPYTKNVEIFISEGTSQVKNAQMDLVSLRSNNQNSSKFSIYVIHGFAESSKNKYDDGRIAFQQFNDYLKNLKFNEKKLYENTSRPLHIYTKRLDLEDGKNIEVEIKHLLVESGIESKGVSFAKFFKEAVELGDVIIYSGHSGLGGNLDIPLLEEKAGRFQFTKNKKQIFFFDSCSSYSYYLDPFLEQKSGSSIDLITYGLSSYFYTGTDVLKSFMKILLSRKNENPTWLNVLNEMEKPLGGDSYLINVGGI
jgi:hypothetical protein